MDCFLEAVQVRFSLKYFSFFFKAIWFTVLSVSWMLLRLTGFLLAWSKIFSYKTVYEAVEEKTVVSFARTDLVNLIVKAD